MSLYQGLGQNVRNTHCPPILIFKKNKNGSTTDIRTYAIKTSTQHFFPTTCSTRVCLFYCISEWNTQRFLSFFCQFAELTNWQNVVFAVWLQYISKTVSIRFQILNNEMTKWPENWKTMENSSKMWLWQFVISQKNLRNEQNATQVLQIVAKSSNDPRASAEAARELTKDCFLRTYFVISPWSLGDTLWWRNCKITVFPNFI